MDKRVGVLTLLAMCCITRPGWAISPDASAIADEFRQFLKEGQQRGGYVGAAAGLIVDGKVVLRSAVGYADKKNGVPMTTQTQVGIGSVTKTFTALAAMQLDEQKTVDIGRPLSDYLPQFHIKTHGEDLKKVTLRALITHTSGVPSDVYKNSDLAHGRYTDVVGLLNETAMAHPPGLVGMYSNAGYNLLANALALASGIDYPVYVEQRIFAPLHMKDSGFAFDLGKRRRTKSYNPDGSEASPPELRDIASGGIYSTVDDLALYAQALMNAYNHHPSSVIRGDTIRKMWTLSNAQIPIDSNKKGLGWFLFKNKTAFAAYHSGSTIYANAALLLIPQQNAAAIILVNTAGGHALAEQFAFHFLEKYGLAVKDILPPPSNEPASTSGQAVLVSGASGHVGYYAEKYGYATVLAKGTGLLIERGGKQVSVEETLRHEFAASADTSGVSNDFYYFKDVGPYHVLFLRHAEHEQALGYRVPMQHLDATWTRRVGRYQLFGYNLQGFEKLVGAEITSVDEGMPLLKLIFNTGTYSYPLVDLAAKEARTGGLGPDNTGDMVYFAGEPGSEVLTYLGLTLRQIKP